MVSCRSLCSPPVLLTLANIAGSDVTKETVLGISPTARRESAGYSVAMKAPKIPHLRLAKPYPPTFGCSVCATMFEGPRTRKGLARDFADHVRQKHAPVPSRERVASARPARKTEVTPAE